MTAQEYIDEELRELKKPLVTEQPSKDELAEQVYKFLMSKQFRKYSVDPEQAEHIKSAIELNIKNNEPIKLTLVFGGYKLWRLDETPLVDWAELFAMMYYTKWLKPICQIYEPGVWFDFFSDDVIVPQMNNISPNDPKVYKESFIKLLSFIKQYQPNNLNMTYNRVGDNYKDDEAFQKDLMEQIKQVASTYRSGFPPVDETMKATLVLNVRLTDEQKADPKWYEKVQLTHDGFSLVKGRRPYYRTPDKVSVLTTRLPGMLSVGTTKDSIMKFWVGVGVLKPLDGSYRQLIMSPNQLKNSKFEFQELALEGLEGKNFKKIRTL